MNIEQKNTLFIISLVSIVLLCVAGASFLLVRDHVRAAIRVDLDRAQTVATHELDNRFAILAAVATDAGAEPGLLAAAQNGNIATISSHLKALYLRFGAEFVAVYFGAGTGTGGELVYPPVQRPGSQLVSGLKKDLAAGATIAFGNTALPDSWLQVAAVPLVRPSAGRVGVLLVGKKFTRSDLDDLRALVHADIAVYNNSELLMGSIDHLPSSPVAATASTADSVMALGDQLYSTRILPAQHRQNSGGTAVDMLLAAPHNRYWAPYKVLGQNALYFSIIILLLAALFGISISRRTLTRPIQALARATQALADGNMRHTVRVSRSDELGQLASTFNVMLGALNSSRLELERNRERFRDFAASSSDWLWETGRGGHFTFVSSSVSGALDMPAESWLGRTLSEVFPDACLGELIDLLRGGETASPHRFKDNEIWVYAANGDQHCLRLSGVPVFSEKEFRGYRGTARDITKLKQDEKRMVILANQDHLTGLSNRRRFLQDLTLEIQRAERQGQLGVLLLVDLDHLKLVNDTAGHAAGDQIIVQVAGLLKRASNDQDFVARISGDEFAVAYAAENEQKGIEKARQFLEHINALKPRFGGRALNISASAGMVTFPHEGRDPVELMAKADAAICAAKSNGRNRVHRYDKSDMMRERMDSQLVWKDRLLEALDNDGLVLVFQPIVGVSSGRIHHYEVLARMRAPDGALIAPGKFIPAAEQFGLIQRVDRYVVSKAIRHLADLPPALAELGFAINLSGLSVGRHDIYELIERELRETGVEPTRITFEITETAVCEQLSTASEFIQKVRRLGCRVSLDDFGVGFSSFSYLKHLHADILKIDGSFIRDIHNNSVDQLFVKALVDVARGMGMQTIAEFVESEPVYQRVRTLGVDYVQGYYLGKPQLQLLKPVAQPRVVRLVRESVG